MEGGVRNRHDGYGARREGAATVDEVTNMVIYLASPQAAATTGGALRVDGGVIDSLMLSIRAVSALTTRQLSYAWRRFQHGLPVLLASPKAVRQFALTISIVDGRSKRCGVDIRRRIIRCITNFDKPSFFVVSHPGGFGVSIDRPTCRSQRLDRGRDIR